MKKRYTSQKKKKKRKKEWAYEQASETIANNERRKGKNSRQKNTERGIEEKKK